MSRSQNSVSICPSLKPTLFPLMPFALCKQSHQCNAKSGAISFTKGFFEDLLRDGPKDISKVGQHFGDSLFLSF